MAVEFVRRVEVGNVLGEGVLWNAQHNTVLWTDIESSRLYEFDPQTDRLDSWATPHRVACFGFVEGRDDLLVAFDRGIALYDVASGATEWLLKPGMLPPGIRFNDGRIDARGRFWVGTMVEDASIATTPAALYRFDPGAGLSEQVSGVTISNGLCWSPDGRRMYHADSPRQEIAVFDFDEDKGTPSRRRTFARTPAGAYPDGSTVDADGGVWNAQWGGGRVVRYAPDGKVSACVDLPVSQPTCAAFGGLDLRTLFVTTAKTGLGARALAAEPGAGDLFVFRTACPGLAAPRFARPGRSTAV